MRWFDGHLDLAYIAAHGRDLTQPLASCGGSLQPATVTFSSLREGDVRAAISTLFVRRRVLADPARGSVGVEGSYCFDTPDEAYAAALDQVDLHRAWREAGWITLESAATPPPPRPALPGDGVPPLLRGASGFYPQHTGEPLRVILALEGAACLRSADDLDFFHAAGVRMVALAWAEGSPYAGGDQSAGDITPVGLTLVRQLDELHCVHDVSHLSERAFWMLFDHAAGPKVASHSNCRALLPGSRSPERHLSDDQIMAIARAGGIIGINLFSRFLVPPEVLQSQRASAADVVRHLSHMAQVAGRRDFLALGSDMDSGFGADLLPHDLQGPAQLIHLAEALSQAGWTDPEIHRFTNRWQEILPVSS